MSTREMPTQRPWPDAERPGGPAMLEADGLGPYPPPGRRRGRRLVAGVLVVAVLGGAGWWLGGHPGLDDSSGATPPAAPLATATVARQDLNGQTKVSGTLGYAGSGTAQSPTTGPHHLAAQGRRGHRSRRHAVFGG